MLLWVALFVTLLWLWHEARLSRERTRRQSPDATLRAANEAGAAAQAFWGERFEDLCQELVTAEDLGWPPLVRTPIWDAREAMRAEMRALGALKRRARVDSLEGRRWVAARLWYALT